VIFFGIEEKSFYAYTRTNLSDPFGNWQLHSIHKSRNKDDINFDYADFDIVNTHHPILYLCFNFQFRRSPASYPEYMRFSLTINDLYFGKRYAFEPDTPKKPVLHHQARGEFYVT
jgi:hypothetical protein